MTIFTANPRKDFWYLFTGSGDYKSLLQNLEIRLRGLNLQPTQVGFAQSLL